ncbi:hypothetical protein GCM10010211_23780 [Streptomyces albospinus]|uniref:Uncharacterized protein n=1 Tax=Streptomyces albospinus TaxID=285515 RepID=A0ABQ2UZ08_9ACTN|nr:hypothetical protein GCM10010211_23780 [Streptomyces albospinus]
MRSPPQSGQKNSPSATVRQDVRTPITHQLRITSASVTPPLPRRHGEVPHGPVAVRYVMLATYVMRRQYPVSDNARTPGRNAGAPPPPRRKERGPPDVPGRVVSGPRG